MGKNKTAEGKFLKDDLSNYDENAYKRPSVTVDIIICTIKDNDLKVLLIKRKYPPFRDCWALPGGFVQVENGESLEETARRELQEETGLMDIYIEQLKTYGDPKRDPRMRVVTVAYFALVQFDRVSNLNPSDDAKGADWFSLKNCVGLDNTSIYDIAFDHGIILRDCLSRLRGKISYSPIAFELVPKKFTWSELQKVYEIILDVKLLAPNFRRKIKSMYVIKEHRSTVKNELGRPSNLLSYTGQKSFL